MLSQPFSSPEALRRAARITLTTVAIALLISYALMGMFSRMMADDYCSAGVVNRLGILPGTWFWYMTWTGRFSASFLDAIAGAVGAWSPIFQPALALLLWLPSLFFLCRKFGYDWREALCIAVTGLILLLATIPNIYESLYWGQGMRSLLPPLIIFCLLFVVRDPILAGILAFAAGGFSETYAATQVAFFGLLFLLNKEDRKRNLAILIGSAAAFVVLAVAPGNAIRSSRLPPFPGKRAMIRITVNSILLFVKENALQNLPALVGLAFFTLIPKHMPIPSRTTAQKLLIGLPIVLLILLAACFAPSAYARSDTLPDRTIIIPQFILLTGLFTWCTALWAWTQVKSKLVVHGIATILLLFLMITSFGKLIDTIPARQQYTRRWEANHHAVLTAKQAGASSVQLPQVQNPYMNEVAQWVDDCMIDYYQIQITRP